LKRYQYVNSFFLILKIKIKIGSYLLIFSSTTITKKNSLSQILLSPKVGKGAEKVTKVYIYINIYICIPFLNPALYWRNDGNQQPIKSAAFVVLLGVRECP
jgi:hypothetical protein